MVSLEPLGREQQPLRSATRDPIRFIPAALLKLVLRLPLPCPTSAPARHQFRIERIPLPIQGGVTVLAAGVFVGQSLTGLAKELAAPLRSAQLLWQLVTTRVPIPLILGSVDQLRLGKDLPRDLLKADLDLLAGIAREASAIDRDHPGLHQLRPIAQLQNLTEQFGQLRLVPNNEPRNRRMIRNHIAGDHPIRHILTAVTLNRPRGTYIGRIRVHQQRHQLEFNRSSQRGVAGDSKDWK